MSEQSKEETARGLVLVVEDEPAIVDVITRSLTSAGFAVHAERDGDAAIAAADRLRPAAIVLDIGLPGRDGVEICRTLRARGDWTPVLFVTARDDDVDRVIGLEIGADDYIVKPFSPRELAARVKAGLRRTAGQGNGEVWQQSNYSRNIVRDCDTAVTIEKDLFGYKMRVESENRSIRIRPLN